MDAPALPSADQLFDDAPCGHFVAGPDGRLLRVNRTLCQWLGRDAAAMVGGLKFQDLLTMGGRIFHQTHLQPLLRMQASVGEVKLELRRGDGTAAPMLLNLAERSWEGQMLLHGAVFLAEDRIKYERELLVQRNRATELAQRYARAQQELADARSQAEDRALFAEQLVGIVSHDIRNPLSVIHMSTVLLERQGLAEGQRAVVARASRAVDRLQHLIQDLLDFTQARVGGGLRVLPAQEDVHRVARDAVQELSAAFPARAIRHAPEGDGAAWIDAHRLTQAIGNLVANAVTHGAPDSPVTVGSRGAALGVELTVHNHGAPIPEALLPTLFQPMVQGGERRDGGGIGLGLFIVSEIARRHGGNAHVHSTPEAGTTFTLRLPRAPAAPVQPVGSAN